MKPLKITAMLAGPVAGEIPMLDALLECVMARRMESVMSSSNGNRHLTRTALRGQLPINPGAIPIPIDRRRVAGFEWPIPCCSSPIFVAKYDGADHYARRFDVDPELIDPDNRKVYYSNSGEFKASRLPLRVRTIDRIVWFALGRGRPNGEGRKGGASEVRKLLRQVTHVGKKNSQGYGRVASWNVEMVDEDWSWFAPSDVGKVLMRPLPATLMSDEVIGARRWFGGIVGPYWANEFFCESIIPC